MLGGRNAAVRLDGGKETRQDVALKLVAEEQALRQAGTEERQRSKTSKVARGPVMRPSLYDELMKKSGGSLRPYIILPRNSKCLLNLLNGKEFLENMRYTPPSGDVCAAAEFEVSAKINGKALVFRVVDDTTRFKKLDWQMCVAVFIDGTGWQFNNWPFASVADLFATIKGFHIAYDTTATPVYTNTLTGEMWSAAQKELIGHVIVDHFPVTKYTVKRSTISRHIDALCAYQFWKEVEAFLLKPRIPHFYNGPGLGKPGGGRVGR
jgi:hypothetical protein